MRTRTQSRVAGKEAAAVESISSQNLPGAPCTASSRSAYAALLLHPSVTGFSTENTFWKESRQLISSDVKVK